MLIKKNPCLSPDEPGLFALRSDPVVDGIPLKIDIVIGIILTCLA